MRVNNSGHGRRVSTKMVAKRPLKNIRNKHEETRKAIVKLARRSYPTSKNKRRGCKYLQRLRKEAEQEPKGFCEQKKDQRRPGLMISVNNSIIAQRCRKSFLRKIQVREEEIVRMESHGTSLKTGD